jgi:F-type H+-transporting ATPase subunit epsilon
MSDTSGTSNSVRTIMLEVVTPYHHFYEGKVEQVVLAAIDGEYGVLPGHAPVVIALTPGIAHITIDGQIRHAVMTEGYAEIGPYIVIVVCNAAEWVEYIDVKRAQAALERADKRFHDNAESPEEHVFAHRSIRRAKVRLKAVSQYGTEQQKRLLSGQIGD